MNGKRRPFAALLRKSPRLSSCRNCLLLFAGFYVGYRQQQKEKADHKGLLFFLVRSGGLEPP
ncbi:MAG: hypothetical protein IJC53_01625, partial [Clostridia bacterium]|nr:hypothetical protein [Clostridia bacterium]